MNRKKIAFFAISLVTVIFFSYLYLQRSASISFVDEFDNISAAHFMTQGKILFKDIYHNRQLGMVYISYLIQLLLHPITLYKLILYHRLFVIISSAIFGGLFIFRFGYPALYTFALLETIKFYSFGNLFQGESVIIYPLLYLAGLFLEKARHKRFELMDSILVGLFSYFVIFTRETFIPLALLLLFLLLLRQKNKKLKIIAVSITISLSLITLISVPIKDFIYNLVYVNQHANFGGELNLLKSFLYPIYLFIDGPLTYTKITFLLITSGFLISLFYSRKFIELAILGLAAIRVIPPGTEYFSAYKMLIWYGLIVFFTSLTINKKNKYMIGGLLTAALLFALFHPQSIVRQKVNKGRDFDIAYNTYFVNGEVIKTLSRPGDALYVDGYQSLLFWTAKLPSSYIYTFYYPLVRNLSKYSDERIRMFRTSSPTFYFRDCLDPYKLNLPNFVKDQYHELKSRSKPSCLYVKKSRLGDITLEMKDSLKKFNYSL